jgi:hypothetical protein
MLKPQMLTSKLFLIRKRGGLVLNIKTTLTSKEYGKSRDPFTF